MSRSQQLSEVRVTTSGVLWDRRFFISAPLKLEAWRLGDWGVEQQAADHTASTWTPTSM